MQWRRGSICVSGGFAVGVFALVVSPACDKQEPSAEGADAKQAEAEAAKADEPEAKEEQPSFADPKPEPPPAPAGAVTLADPWLYVQTCDEANPCPDMLQPAGEAHCRELALGEVSPWRLPKKDEVARFAGAEGLAATEGHHWTQTPFEEDAKQVYIVDPSNASYTTTVPRDRKPFRIRCVREP
ncbi:hypothetical protein [Plesiocystis pacifica]|uniref:hypothetical protein n=1 Tax=Plesiocystis pacifica TaxID=191768 RepID=UPI0012FCBDD0|nr:hypothetical protein [Plesiocystis pacifica]